MTLKLPFAWVSQMPAGTDRSTLPEARASERVTSPNPATAVIRSQLRGRERQSLSRRLVVNDFEAGHENAEVGDCSLWPPVEALREFWLVSSIREVVFPVLGRTGCSDHFVVNTVVRNVRQGVATVASSKSSRGLRWYTDDRDLDVGIHRPSSVVLSSNPGRGGNRSTTLPFFVYPASRFDFLPSVALESPCAVVAARRDHKANERTAAPALPGLSRPVEGELTRLGSRVSGTNPCE